MSDEFLKAARREINDELIKIENIVARCSNDKHIQENAIHIQSHIHKIKGLAPMMGQINIGRLANTSEAILKQIAKNDPFPNTYKVLVDAFQKMRFLLERGNESLNINDFIKNIEKNF